MTSGSGAVFYLDSLNIGISSIKATLHEGSDTTDSGKTYDSVAVLSIPHSWATNTFQYQADGIDVDDLNTDDIKFRMFYRDEIRDGSEITVEKLSYFNATNVKPGNAKVTGGFISFYNIEDIHDENKQITYDFIRYIAVQFFGQPATDLFNNETAVRNDINQKTIDAFSDMIKDYSTFRVNYGTTVTEENKDYVRMVTNTDTAPYETVDNREKANNFPPRLVFRQLITSHKQRFQNIDFVNYDTESSKVKDMRHLYYEDDTEIPRLDHDDNDETPAVPFIGTDKLWRGMPFMIDDAIVFWLTINPNEDQKNLLGTEKEILKRVYKVILSIVDDDDERVSNWKPITS